MKGTVYIETTVVSYYTSRPSRDLVVAGRQEVTRELWATILAEFECHTSVLVLEEASQGDSQASEARLAALSRLSVLGTDEAVEGLAAALVAQGAIPSEHLEDAIHVALAARHGMDYLLTWNSAHIHNAQLENRIREVLEQRGYRSPVFCSPDELIGE